jgi:hypothetical protein
LFPKDKPAKDDATNELLWNEGSTEDGFKGGDNTLEDDQIPTVLGLLVAPCEVDLLVADKIWWFWQLSLLVSINATASIESGSLWQTEFSLLVSLIGTWSVILDDGFKSPTGSSGAGKSAKSVDAIAAAVGNRGWKSHGEQKPGMKDYTKTGNHQLDEAQPWLLNNAFLGLKWQHFFS